MEIVLNINILESILLFNKQFVKYRLYDSSMASTACAAE